MPSSHHRYRQDETVLSCRRCEQNWRRVETVDDRKCWNCFVRSRNVVWTEFCIVDPVSDLQLGLVCERVTEQTGLDKTFQFPIYWGLLKTVLTCRQFCLHHWQDKTCCLVLSHGLRAYTVSIQDPNILVMDASTAVHITGLAALLSSSVVCQFNKVALHLACLVK